MSEIPVPHVLDPNRLVVNSRGDFTEHDRSEFLPQLEDALRESCEYGKQLWQELAAIREYLLDSLPPGNSGTSNSPIAPRDDSGWDRWMSAYSTATSALAGPHGDSGYGAQEARQAVQSRR